MAKGGRALSCRRRSFIVRPAGKEYPVAAHPSLGFLQTIDRTWKSTDLRTSGGRLWEAPPGGAAQTAACGIPDSCGAASCRAGSSN
jgi:hypothetical protein